tara:strand:+ start:9456 stop:9647 length:192 start_codon:yes stop_codon:yes gene_type:complete
MLGKILVVELGLVESGIYQHAASRQYHVGADVDPAVPENEHAMVNSTVVTDRDVLRGYHRKIP